MLTMENLLKVTSKNLFFKAYIKIIKSPKEYSKITGKKIIQELEDFYSNYENIIKICTERELKCLEEIYDNGYEISQKYNWEISSLCDKMIINIDTHNNKYVVFDNIKEFVKEALNNVDYKIVRRNDQINELIIGLVRSMGSIEYQQLINMIQNLSGMSTEKIEFWIHVNPQIRYYLEFYDEYDEFDGIITTVFYRDFYEILELIEQEKRLMAPLNFKTLTKDDYKNIFYTGFINRNKYLNNCLDIAKKLNRMEMKNVICALEMNLLFNNDYEKLERVFKTFDYLTPEICEKLITNYKKAYKDIPSGCLNGYSPNELKGIKKDNKKGESKNIKQENANLSKEDCDLFYKLYMGLLDFTNQKYKVIRGFKIYNAKSLNTKLLTSVIEKLWENCNNTIDEFIIKNPYNFTKEELNIVKEFKKGKRYLYIICKYNKDNTLFLDSKNIYAVKGLVSNIDEVFNYKKLPRPVITTLLPFKGFIVYDSIFLEQEITFNDKIKTIIDNNIKSSKITYKL